MAAATTFKFDIETSLTRSSADAGTARHASVGWRD